MKILFKKRSDKNYEANKIYKNLFEKFEKTVKNFLFLKQIKRV